MHLISQQDPSIRGIFHFSGKEQMTKYEMAVAMAQAFNLPSNHLIPVSQLIMFFLENPDRSVITHICNGVSPTLQITADGAAGRIRPSSNQQPAELFPPGAAEPERGAASVLRRHHRVSVAVHGGQTLETNGLPLRLFLLSKLLQQKIK